MHKYEITLIMQDDREITYKFDCEYAKEEMTQYNVESNIPGFIHGEMVKSYKNLIELGDEA